MEEKRDSFVFYKTFIDVVEVVSDEHTQLQALKAIIEYGLYGKEPDKNANEIIKVILTSVRTNIDHAKHRYDTSVENGKKGGRPRKDKNPTKPNKTQQNPNKPGANLNDNDNVNVDDNVDDNVCDKGTHTRTQEEIEDLTSFPIEERKQDFYEEVMAYSNDYDNDFLVSFFNYWTETNRNNIMRFELQDYWNTEKRLGRWEKTERY